MKVRLNFSITEPLKARLDRYCEGVGRTASDVVRQLILEYLDDDLPLPDLSDDSGLERRSSLLLPHEVLDAFDRKTRAFRVTKSRLVSGLLRLFLFQRENVDSDVLRNKHKEVLTKLVKALLTPSYDVSASGVPAYVEPLAEAIELLDIEVEEHHECRS